jgi:hypothetical protein
MLTLKIDVRAKCERHPGYDPAKEGRGGIRAGCQRCEALLELYLSSYDALRVLELDSAHLLTGQPTLERSGRYISRKPGVAGSAHFRYRNGGDERPEAA